MTKRRVELRCPIHKLPLRHLRGQWSPRSRASCRPGPSPVGSNRPDRAPAALPAPHRAPGLRRRSVYSETAKVVLQKAASVCGDDARKRNGAVLSNGPKSSRPERQPGHCKRGRATASAAVVPGRRQTNLKSGGCEPRAKGLVQDAGRRTRLHPLVRAWFEAADTAPPLSQPSKHPGTFSRSRHGRLLGVTVSAYAPALGAFSVPDGMRGSQRKTVRRRRRPLRVVGVPTSA